MGRMLGVIQHGSVDRRESGWDWDRIDVFVVGGMVVVGFGGGVVGYLVQRGTDGMRCVRVGWGTDSDRFQDREEILGLELDGSWAAGQVDRGIDMYDYGWMDMSGV